MGRLFFGMLVFLLFAANPSPAPAHSAEEIPDSAQGISPPMIGATLPELKLKTADGEDFDLNAAVAKQRTLLIIYRGGW